MKALELLVDVARIPHYHTIEAEVDGWDAEVVEVVPAGGGNATLVVELDDAHTVLPLDPDGSMLDAAFEKLSMPPTLARNAWRVMCEAFQESQE